MMIEEKEITINEENTIVIMFFRSVMVEEGKKKNEIKYLINEAV